LSITDASLAVQNFRVRFNTAVSLVSSKAAMAIGSGYDNYKVEVYGNILVNTASSMYMSGSPSLNSRNYMTSSLTGFQNASLPYDFHLLSTHPARNYANGVPGFPAVDIDGQSRLATSLDAGADQFANTAPVDPPPTACSLKVESPNGGEVFYRGQLLRVRWGGRTAGAANRVQVRLKRDATVTILRSGTANDGYIEWRIPSGQATSSSYVIQIVDSESAQCSDNSDGMFRIR
jgi:hypothetical protein